ncbi:MAG: hypothetical protein ACKV22_16050 [Bryobacteraceae bacterium]
MIEIRQIQSSLMRVGHGAIPATVILGMVHGGVLRGRSAPGAASRITGVRARTGRIASGAFVVAFDLR